MSEERCELPLGWVEVDFEQCIDVPKGPFIKIPQKQYSPQGKYPIVDQGSEFIAGYTNNNNDLFNGDLPVVIFGDHTRIFKFVDFAFAIGADGTKILKVKKGIDSKYIFYYLRSIELPSRGYSRHYRYLRENKILLAPENEQKRIVEKIEILFDHLNKARQELVKIPPLIKKFRQSILAKAFSGELTKEWRGQQESLESASALLASIREERKKELGKKYRDSEPIGSSDLTELPEDWEWAHLSFVSEKIQYGYTERATDIKIGPKFLRITDIAEDGTVEWEKVPYCKCNEANKRKYMLKNGDIVVARTGATTGKNYLVKDCPEVVFASYLISIRVSKEINSEYISYFMSSNYYWNQIMTMQKGTAQPGANATILSSLVVPVASLTEQYEIIRRVKELNAQADTIEKSVKIAQAHCQKLAQSILTRAFRGELVEQDPDDEPAGELSRKTQLRRKI